MDSHGIENVSHKENRHLSNVRRKSSSLMSKSPPGETNNAAGMGCRATLVTSVAVVDYYAVEKTDCEDQIAFNPGRVGRL
jgi:hypothetical protein